MPLTGPGTNSFPGNGVIIIDETPIVGGTDGYVLYDNNGVVGVEAGGGGGSLTIGTTPISGGTANYALTVDPTGLLLDEAPIRTILTGNLSLYIEEFFGAITGGSGYTQGFYGFNAPIPFTGGHGSGAMGYVRINSAGNADLVALTSEGLGGYQVGDVLSANTADLGGSGSGFSVLVALNGSDVTGNGTSGKPWSTLQHAYDVISSDYDTAGFIITPTLGNGTFGGASGKPIVGGGIIQTNGAGSTNTILVNGPADGVYNFQECWGTNSLLGAPFFINGVTLDNEQNTSATSSLIVWTPNQFFGAGDFSSFGSGDVVFKAGPGYGAGAGGNGPSIQIQGQFSSFTTTPGTYVFDHTAGVSVFDDISLAADTEFVAYGTLSVTGNIGYSGEFLGVARGAIFDGETGGVAITGTSTGNPFNVAGTALINGNTLPGNTNGVLQVGGYIDIPFTVATLPSASATNAKGATTFVTDALAPVSGSPVVGGGSVYCPVFSNGTTWIADIAASGGSPGGSTGDVQYNNGSGGFAGGAPIAVSSTDTPATLFGSDLKAWYKADTGVTLSGSSVTGWADQSGGGNNLSVAGGFTSPTFDQYALGGFSALRFMLPTNNLSKLVTLFTGTTASFFAVVRCWFAPSVNARLLAYYDTGGQDYQDATGSLIWDMNPDNFYSDLATYNNSTKYNTVFLPGANIAIRLSSVFDGTNITSYVNNTQLGQAALSFTWGASKALSLGVTAATNGMLFDISELVVIDRAPTSTEAAKLDTYFLSKWGIRPFYG